jgi:Skp family chaperone for outer membrane proteins
MTVVVRRLLTGLTLVSLCAAGAASAQQPQNPAGAPGGSAGGRIAFVNARAVLQGMPGYAKAESTFTKEYNAAQGDAQKMQAVFDSTVAAYQQSMAMLSPSARTAREKALTAQKDSLDARLASLRDKVDGRERELLSPMQQRLQAIIDGIRAEGNYWMVIDLGNASAIPFLVSYDKSLDITDRVVRRLLQSN